MYQHILVPTDGTRLSELALNAAIALAAKLGSRLHVLHVVTEYAGDARGVLPELASSAREAFQQRAVAEAESILKGAERIARAHHVAVDGAYVFADDPYRVIVDRAEAQACDLIVMASHGRRGLQAMLLGSETQKVLTHSRVPVLVVRGAAS